MNRLDYLGCLLILATGVVCAYIYLRESDFQLKCIVSGIDGNKYCVRDRAKLQDAADLLARVTEKCKALVAYMVDRHPNNETVAMLVKNYNPEKIMETLPTSTYTAYSENKGEKIAFCLNKKKLDNDDLIDEHTLMFVAIHEMSHTCTESVGHKEIFWTNFSFLLANAKAAGIHEPRDYSSSPAEYCGMEIKDSPYFQL